MSEFVLTALQYYGAAAATLAALLISMHIGRVWTGIAFVIFVTSSVSLILWGFFAEDSEGIGWQNVILLGINCLGVYRYLIAGKGDRDVSGRGGSRRFSSGMKKAP